MSDLLPANATAAERSVSLAVERAAGMPVPVRDVWNPDTCPANLLAWLAWAWSVDVWDPTWTDLQKRQAIKASLDVHRYKGTIGAVREALAALQFDVRVQEWFNQIPEGSAYTFRILLEANQIGIDQSSIQQLFSVIERTKNLRSHLDRVDLSVVTAAGPYVAAVGGLGSEIVVTNYVWAPLACNETTFILTTEIVVFNETTVCY